MAYNSGFTHQRMMQRRHYKREAYQATKVQTLVDQFPLPEALTVTLAEFIEQQHALAVEVLTVGACNCDPIPPGGHKVVKRPTKWTGSGWKHAEWCAARTTTVVRHPMTELELELNKRVWTAQYEQWQEMCRQVDAPLRAVGAAAGGRRG